MTGPMKAIVALVAISLSGSACAPTPPSPPRSATGPTTTAASTATATTVEVAPADPGQPSTQPSTHPSTPPATGRPQSLDDLVTRALGALKAGDGEAYNALMFTQEDVKRSCPELLKDVNAALLAKMARSVSERVGRCGQLAWAGAKEVRRSGGTRKGRSKDCSQEVWELHDVAITFDIGGQEVIVKLDDPMEFPGGTFAFADDPRCGAAFQKLTQ
jgi:hypothetical protein